MSNQPFRFKQFTVNQARSAMKVGTDGILLGAWTPFDHKPCSILDVGAGTGLISLMLAQRSKADTIDAIEIDESAYEECVDNFERSDWSDRLFCYHASFLEFVAEIDDQYDLIVSNPPFYDDDFKTGDDQRFLARFSDALPMKHLLFGVSKLLSRSGVFSAIIPFKEEDKFLDYAKEVGLYPSQILRTKGRPNSKIKRSLLSLSFLESEVEINELIIETDRHNYTTEFKALTSDFYLNM